MIVATDAQLAVNEHEPVAVCDRRGRGAVVGERYVKPVAQEGGNRIAGAGDEEPPGSRARPRRVLTKDLGRVPRRVDAERDQPHAVELALEAREPARQRGADVGAVREDEVRDPDVAGEILGAQRVAAALREGEGWNRAEDGQALVPAACGRYQQDSGEQRDAPTPNARVPGSRRAPPPGRLSDALQPPRRAAWPG